MAAPAGYARPGRPAVALALSPGSQAGHRGGQGGVKLAAWSVIKGRHGLVKVTIRELRDPAGLQKTLRAAGVPANVRFVHHFFQPPNSVHLPRAAWRRRCPIRPSPN
jgi:hypothetical protein